MSTTKPRTDVLRNAYQKSVAAYWNDNNQDPVNLVLGEIDGLYHHHYGVGDPDPSVLEGPEETRDERIINDLHRLETAQADLLLDHFGDIKPDDHLLDAGSGRGALSIMANRRFGCYVDGVTISEYQVGFANERAAELGVTERVKYHFCNMLDTPFQTSSLQGVWTDETTMYVDLHQLFSEFSRVLDVGGRYVCITGCYNDVTGRSQAVHTIDQHYICNIHARSEYFRALAANKLVPISVVDLTDLTIPYWELRAKSSLATGIEDAFLEGYRNGSFQYLLIAADRV